SSPAVMPFAIDAMNANQKEEARQYLENKLAETGERYLTGTYHAMLGYLQYSLAMEKLAEGSIIKSKLYYARKEKKTGESEKLEQESLKVKNDTLELFKESCDNFNADTVINPESARSYNGLARNFLWLSGVATGEGYLAKAKMALEAGTERDPMLTVFFLDSIDYFLEYAENVIGKNSRAAAEAQKFRAAAVTLAKNSREKIRQVFISMHRENEYPKWLDE
ncbi:MAG: hypothetical protein JXR97_13660, partial [Planctomycetes bacterium]|nr:hypothetical protein [Planctomycetota bacterium]